MSRGLMEKFIRIWFGDLIDEIKRDGLTTDFSLAKSSHRTIEFFEKMIKFARSAGLSIEPKQEVQGDRINFAIVIPPKAKGEK